MDLPIRPITPEELSARIKVLMKERSDLAKHYQDRHNHISEEIQYLTMQLNEVTARQDNDMPF